jgi:glycosyltransferase involved in cell wall biosynthesis
MNSSIGVAAVGNVLDVNCWSNIPYYFYQSGNQAKLFNQPWSLNLEKLNFQRRVWNMKQLVSGKGTGGFQYSKSFLEKAEKQIPIEYLSSSIISLNQTFPRAQTIKKNGGKIYYYIDITLHDLFNEPDYGIQISEAMKIQALNTERENYQQAEAVVSMGSWVKNSLVTYYDLPENKIHTILPGANIALSPYTQIKGFVPGAGIERDLVLGFVGKDWKRKGLPLLLEVSEILMTKGYKVKTKLIGNCPVELLHNKSIEYTGFIDKQSDSEKFREIVSSCDIGCLFSTSEALGISTLEFLRLGIPVAGFYHQGLKDTLLEGASFRFSIENSAFLIAAELEKYMRNESLQTEMKLKAIEYSRFVTWERCIQEWSKLLSK